MNHSDSMNSPIEAGTTVATQPSSKRTWRVGSLSMGITMILIGTAFAVSLWQDTEIYDLLAWVAPVIFILLGTELLLYLAMSGNRNNIVRYDWMSIFFVGLIGMASVVLALLMSTGLIEEMKQGLHATERTTFVESEKVTVPTEVNKIVVQSDGGVTIERANTKDIQLIGQIRNWSVEPMSNVNDSLIQTNIVGSTMYVLIRSIDHNESVFVSDGTQTRLILTLPQNIKIEDWG
ncbi:hypothetical protein I6N90_18710 [Paenibacillus sp. GSMTC-2017]|uniref:hypothetical protein n=1 Tax=Paenibacillus sp. GSMTC-2017 TaxID=2794350 RepID=UPI0018D8B56A|nr:hypothetical protein [Paenibacillus sp. GSMTC-2017]MBH5319835.1 hypothetical protein [Paenibacillus sp. GSMTC-2017]